MRAAEGHDPLLQEMKMFKWLAREIAERQSALEADFHESGHKIDRSNEAWSYHRGAEQSRGTARVRQHDSGEERSGRSKLERSLLKEEPLQPRERLKQPADAFALRRAQEDMVGVAALHQTRSER